MGRRIANVLSLVALGGVVAVLAHHGTATATATSALADAAHYRYPIARAQRDDVSEIIAAYEARVAGPVASPMEMADLADLYLKRAQVAGDPEDFARAEAMAKRSHDLLPYPSSTPLTLAKLASARHDFHTAIAMATEFLHHKRSAGALGVLAASHLALGELDRAAWAAEAAVGVKPDSGAYLMRALVFQAQGRDAEAAWDFARAAAVEEAGDPDEAARLRALWGRFLLRRGDWAGAGDVLAEAVRVAPGYPLAVAQQAELALRTGDPKAAKARFEQAFVASHQVRYLIDEARAQELAGDAAGATSTRNLVEKLVRAELRDTGVGHRLELVEVLLDRGAPADLAEATRLAREEQAARPSADTQLQLARALAAGGDRSGSLDAVRAALATGARDARIYELASRLERAGGNGARAELYAAEATRLDPGSSGWRGLGLRVLP